MIIIGKSRAALTLIFDAAFSQSDAELYVFNNLNIPEPFIYNGITIPEVTEITGREFILGAVMPETKRKIVEKFPLRYKSMQNRFSYIEDFSKVGHGCLIDANATICGNALLGDYVTVYCNASINHDCRIENYVTICPNVAVCGDVTIGEGSFIGAGSVIKNGITIGKNCVIGCGSVVIRDVEDNQTVYGNPAKPNV